jgi:hypothetical protein
LISWVQLRRMARASRASARAAERPKRPPHTAAAPQPEAALEALLPLAPDLIGVRLEEPAEGRGTGIPDPAAGSVALARSDARRFLQRGRTASE